MELRHLRTTAQGAVRRLTLSGEPLSQREALELSSALREIAEERDIHVVVVDVSCPGASFDPSSSGVDPAADLGALRPPVVVAASGRVASVGLEIALAGDIRVAAPGTTFAMPDVREGRLPCWGGTQRLVRAVGRPYALSMLLLGDEPDADEALARGLVHRIAGSVDDVVEGLLALGPLALEYAKEAVLEGSERTMRDGLRLEADLGLLLQASHDRADGIAAFLEKRPSAFEGR